MPFMYARYLDVYIHLLYFAGNTFVYYLLLEIVLSAAAKKEKRCVLGNKQRKRG